MKHCRPPGFMPDVTDGCASEASRVRMQDWSLVLQKKISLIQRAPAFDTMSSFNIFRSKTPLEPTPVADWIVESSLHHLVLDQKVVFRKGHVRTNS